MDYKVLAIPLIIIGFYIWHDFAFAFLVICGMMAPIAIFYIYIKIWYTALQAVFEQKL